jgi:prepilin-type N-terminal cleavage/methylation domain-containing protein
MRARSRGGRRGFTLIEVIIVVFLMSLAAGMTMGYNFAFKANLELRDAARRTYAFMRAQRSHSLVLADENAIVYDPAANELTGEMGEKPLGLPEGIRLVRGAEDLVLPATDEDGQREDDDLAVSIIVEWDPRVLEDGEEFPEPFEVLRFYADGSSDDAGFLLVNDSKGIRMTLDPVLGVVKIHDAASLETIISEGAG